MRPVRVLQHAVVVSALLIVSSGFLFTMTAWHLPLIPLSLIHFSYATMAPYQGYSTTNDTLIARGILEDGTTEEIDLSRYYPQSLGWNTIRMHMRTFKTVEGDRPGELPALREKYRELGMLLLDREHARGKQYNTIELLWHEWPSSPAGYYALHLPPYTEEEFIVRIP
ncbi:MAG: hypothetical protein Q7R81_03045 [Candidatus Peregrinibacteria bacterium]|nr:hypothetical protein [Candidatus Peregrinibacteria bacterium]